MTMHKIFLTLLTVSLALTVQAQAPPSLSDRLWERVQGCHASLEDVDEDGKIDYDELVDDSRNGYLKISGAWPTCGCNCVDVVGAYRDGNGNYTFLEQERWGCEWINQVSSNRELKDVFPEDWGLQRFIPGLTEDRSDKARFFVEVEVPRIGTDTRVSIQLIPFGFNYGNEGSLSFGYSEKDPQAGTRSLFNINMLARKFQDEKTFDYLLQEQFDAISAADRAHIEVYLGERWGQFESMEELALHFQDLKRTYDLYSQLKHESLTLGWNRAQGRFFVKEKGSAPKALSFKEFLLENEYWTARC
jgi:hypothetical protein